MINRITYLEYTQDIMKSLEGEKNIGSNFYSNNSLINDLDRIFKKMI